MGKLIPFVTVKNALEAIEFYKDVFKATIAQEITMLENVPGMEKHKGKVGHATLQFGESTIFINDFIEEFPVKQGENIQLVLDLDTEENLKEAFGRLSKEGKIIEDLHEVFWGALFGTVQDKYNVTWQLYYGHK